MPIKKQAETEEVSAEDIMENAIGKLQEQVSDEDEPAKSPKDGATGESETSEEEEDTTAPEEEESETEDGEDSENAEDAENSEDDSEEGSVFTPEQQAIFNKRLGKEIGKRKELEAKVTELEGQNRELSAKLDPAVVNASTSVGVPPEYLTKEEAGTLSEEAKWKQHRDFCRAHPNGYDGKDGTLTAEQIQDFLNEAMDKLSEVAPEARVIRKTKLRQFTEDAALGRRLRLEKKRAEGAKKAEKKLPAKMAAKPAALAPAAKMKIPKGMSKDRYLKGGETEEAAVRELTNLVV